MGNFTFFTFDGGGNQPPTIGIAGELRDRRHMVRIVGYETQRQRFEAAGLTFTAFPGSGRFRIPDADRAQVRMEMLRAIMCNPEHLVEVPEFAARQDAVVIDNLLMFALAAADRHGIPTIVLMHTVAADFQPTPMRAPMLAAVNQARAAHGMHALRGPLELTDFAPAVIVATLPVLDGYSSEADARWHYVGPVLPPIPKWSESLPWPADDARPLALVSLTTHSVWGPQRDRLQRILDGLASLPIRVLATTGASVPPDELLCPANAVVRSYWPHREVMPGVSVCVTHGGHATLVEALARSVPTVLLPNPMADQLYLADRVASLGAGLMIDQDAPASVIGRAVRNVLADGSYRRAAGALAANIDFGAAARAAEVVETVAVSPSAAAM